MLLPAIGTSRGHGRRRRPSSGRGDPHEASTDSLHQVGASRSCRTLTGRNAPCTDWFSASNLAANLDNEPDGGLRPVPGAASSRSRRTDRRSCASCTTNANTRSADRPACSSVSRLGVYRTLNRQPGHEVLKQHRHLSLKVAALFATGVGMKVGISGIIRPEASTFPARRALSLGGTYASASTRRSLSLRLRSLHLLRPPFVTCHRICRS